MNIQIQLQFLGLIVRPQRAHSGLKSSLPGIRLHLFAHGFFLAKFPSASQGVFPPGRALRSPKLRVVFHLRLLGSEPAGVAWLEGGLGIPINARLRAPPRRASCGNRPTGRGEDRPLRTFGPRRPPSAAGSGVGAAGAAEDHDSAGHGVRL